MRRYGKNGLECGAAIIEFAIVIPFLIAIFVGLINVGGGLYEKQIIVQAAREAAHYASLLIDSKSAETRGAGGNNCADALSLIDDGDLKNIAIQAACEHLTKSQLDPGNWNVNVLFPDVSFSDSNGRDTLVRVEIARKDPGCILCFSSFVHVGVGAISTF